MPLFIFAKLILPYQKPESDSVSYTHLVKGMEQIAQEGAIQIFKELGGGMEEVIVGVVGVLQFEVLEYRLKNEYNVDIRMQNLPYSFIPVSYTHLGGRCGTCAGL